jgi:hypothetical protein
VSSVPGERDPAAVQAERRTPGKAAADRVTFGDDEARRTVARDAMSMMRWADFEPRAGHPYHAGGDQAQRQEAILRVIGETDLRGEWDDDGDYDLPPDPIGDAVLALTEDHDGAEAHGPFKAGALAGEAMLRSGDVTFAGYEDEPEPFDDESEAVFIDVDTGEAVDPGPRDP